MVGGGLMARRRVRAPQSHTCIDVLNDPNAPLDSVMQALKQTPGSGPETLREQFSSLEEMLQTRFVFWKRTAGGAYEVFESPAEWDEDRATCLALIESAREERAPVAQELPDGRHRLALPWVREYGRTFYVTATLKTETPQVALELIRLRLLETRNQARITELQEENDAYLLQLNEDMEEQVFLRSMADKLALGDLSLSSSLLKFILPKLGESTGVEAVFFVDCRLGAQPEVTNSWRCPSSHSNLQIATVAKIVEDYCYPTQESPIVENHLQEKEQGVNYPGVEGFALVPVATHLVTFGWLVAVNRKSSELENHQHPVWQLGTDELGTCEVALMSTTAAMLASYTHNLSLFEERESLLLSVVRTLVSAIESRDQYTCGHSERVARYAKRLAQELDYDEEGCKRMYLTGLLHDIGKIGLSDSVLKKEGPLTEEEYAEIKKHPDLGWAILRELEQLDYVLPGVLYHHERADGKGYPDGLLRDDIPLEGRLLAVVDAFDAMTSDRPYRKGMDWEKAVKILAEGADTQWDAEVVDKFVAIMPDILTIRDNYRRPPLPVRKQDQIQVVAPLVGDSLGHDLTKLIPGQ